MQTPWWKTIYTKREFHFFLVGVCVFMFIMVVAPWKKVSAASEVISCNSGGDRTISVGTYTDSDGTQFSDGADLTLNVGTGGSCTFTLNLLGTDSAVNLSSLTIDSGVTLTHDMAVTTDGTYYKLDLNITGTLTVNTGASIDVSGKGLKSTSDGSGYGFSPDGSTIDTFYGSTSGNGGSHGGPGGKYSFFGGIGYQYDSVSQPVLPGNSGAAFFAGATGGGVVIIYAATTTIDGTINANGKDVNFAGNGAGGSIYLTIDGALLGSGTISANGGAGGSANGAGGGGRIALYYTSIGSVTVEAKAGNSSNSFSDGGAGTIFKKPVGQTYGDLLLDSGASATESYYATQLVYPVPTPDAVALYGGAYVFNSVTLNNNAVLDLSSSLDPNGTGVSSAGRKIYIANTASCIGDYNDTTLSNGQIQYNIGYIADPSSYQSNYVCVAPEFVIELSSTSGAASESVADGSFEIQLPVSAPEDITVDYAVYAPSSTATGGVDYTLDNGTATILTGETTTTISFSITDDTDPESDETFAFDLSNPSFGVIGGNSRFLYTIEDNDTSGVTFNTGTGVNVSEGSTSPDTYSVVLDSQPSNDVTITVTPDAQLSVSPSTLTFTSANWDTPQTVSVLAIDDGYAESSHTGTITHTVESADLGYDGLTLDSITASISDNDFAGVSVNSTDGGTNISENGLTDTYTLRLNTIPSADVTIAISPDADSTVDPTSVTFTPGNWNVPQSISLTAVDDTDVEGSHSSMISHTATSDDTSYNGIFVGSVFAQVIDNESPAVTALPSGGSTTLREGSTTDTISINLETAPAADVVVSMNAGTDMEVSPTSVTFTSENWLTPQIVVVSAIDDTDFEGSDFGSVSFTVTSADTDYDGRSVSSISTSILDNDGVIITQSGDSTDIAEGGSTDTFDVVLAENPWSNVDVRLSTSTQYTTDVSTLSFTSANWDTPQTVTVTAVDDTDVEGNHTANISYTLTTFSFKYSNTIPSPTTVHITDNDAPATGVTVTESAASTDVVEGADTDTYTIVLNTAPVADVTIHIASDTQSTVSTSSIVFTTLNWETPQTITVTAVDDFVAEASPHSSTITHTSVSADADYNEIAIDSVTAHITDNDTAAYIRSPISGNTTEAGGTASFTLALGSQPTANVVIPVSSSDTSEGTVSTSSITFTTSTWNIARTVIVTGVDDVVVDGDISYDINLESAVSGDVYYNGTSPAGLSLSNVDNDVAGVTFVESGDSTDISEAGASDSYTVVLDTQPTFAVTIDISPDDQSTVSTSSIIFTTSNWNVPKTVTVSAVDDNIAEAAHTSTISHTASSDDSAYAGLGLSSVTAHITDNDTAGVSASAISGNTTEAGGTATFTIVLTSRPVANVDVPISTSDSTEGTVNTSSIRFTPATWSNPRTVTVTGVDDVIDDGDVAYTIVLGASVSSDPNYSGINPSDVSVTNTDNDTAGVTLLESGDTTNISEGGSTDTYTIVLDTQPTDVVTTTITTDAQSTASPLVIVFTTSNWDTPQTVTLTAVNDNVVEDAHTSTITASAVSSDENYNGVDIASVTAHITDNDTVGFTISEISADTTEAGGTATFTVVLNSQPTANVQIPVSSSDLTEGTVNTTTLTFAPSTWNTAHSVTVTGVNDFLIDGDVDYSIVLGSITSADTHYNNLNPNDVSVTNTDNDSAGITITESDDITNVSEAGSGDAYTVVLNSVPTSDVSIVFTPDEQIQLSSSSIVFTSENWDEPQTITVSAVNDTTVNGNRSVSISGEVTSDDLLYNAVVLDDITVNIVDDDNVERRRHENEESTPVTAPTSNEQTSTSTPTDTTQTPPSETTIVLVDATAKEIVIGQETHHVTLVSGSDASATIILQSNPIVVSLAKNETKRVDTNGDAKDDVSVTYLGFVDGQPKFSFIALAGDEVPSVVTTTPPGLPHPTSTCPFLLGQPYKTKASPVVYLIDKPHDAKGTVIENAPCAKRAFPNPDSYFTYFDSWNAVKIVDAKVLQGVQNDVFTTIPTGPRIKVWSGSLLKLIDDPKVYLILGNERHWIQTERIFHALGFLFSWVEQVTTNVLDSFTPGKDVSTLERPEGSVIQYPGDNNVYRVIDNNGTLENQKVGTKNTIENTYRPDRIVTAPAPFTKNLAPKSVGEEVRRLQKVLQTLGYLKAEVSGYYGPKTTQAIKDMQKDYGVVQTGILDEATRKVLNRL